MDILLLDHRCRTCEELFPTTNALKAKGRIHKLKKCTNCKRISEYLKACNNPVVYRIFHTEKREYVGLTLYNRHVIESHCKKEKSLDRRLLRTERRRLFLEHSMLKKENETLREENMKLKEENSTLKNIINNDDLDESFSQTESESQSQ